MHDLKKVIRQKRNDTPPVWTDSTVLIKPDKSSNSSGK